MAKDKLQRLTVDVVHPHEERLRDLIKEVFLFLLLEQFGSQHGGKGQGCKRRNDNGSRNHHTEFTEQASGRSFHEDNRKEHGHQCNRCRDNGKEYFLGTLNTGFFGRHAFFYSDINILGHHDGVIHNQTYSQHNRQHGQHINGESQQIHDKE